MGKDKLYNQIPKKKIIKSLIKSWHAVSDNTEEILNLLNKTKTLNVNCEDVRLTRATQSSLRSCASSPHGISLITALIESSIADPWYQQPLSMILNDNNLNQYCANTNCDVLWTQLNSCTQTSKDFALKLCTSCLTIPEMKENLRVKDMHCTLLFQLGLIDQLSQEMLSYYTSETAIDFVVRLLSHSETEFAFAACVLEIFIVKDLLSQTTYTHTSSLMQMWVSVQYKLGVDLHSLRAKVTMFSGVFKSSAHNYIFVHALVTRFRSELLHECIELYVKGLMVDLNSLEKARMEEFYVRETEVHLAEVYLCLAWIFGEQSLLARECYLSAFSIDPTKKRMKRVREFKGFAKSCHCIVKESCGKFVGRDREVEAQLDGLPEELLGDLDIVLNKPRNKMLSWELEWSELKRRCNVHLDAKCEEPVKKCKNGDRKKAKSQNNNNNNNTLGAPATTRTYKSTSRAQIF